MTDSGWSRDGSPFHAGEREIQTQLGVREKLEAFGQRGVRDYMPDEHRQFYAQLPCLIAGTVDRAGRPWASILAGAPGFLSTPDPRTLRVAARPLFGDPLRETLAADADIGLLGIEAHTRRRNRMNGTVITMSDTAFEVRVGQTFGNCPKYIQRRAFELTDFHEAGTPRPRHHLDALGEAERAMIGGADTFFIATACVLRGDITQGVDVSHRGGKPGFVRIDGPRTLTIPDFVGNFFFNTLGNLRLNPRAGLLFVDFDRGDLLYMSGEVEVVWEGDEVRAFAGAERLLRFHLAQAIRVLGALPLRGSFQDYSPQLTRTGSWEQAARTLAAKTSRNE